MIRQYHTDALDILRHLRNRLECDGRRLETELDLANQAIFAVRMIDPAFHEELDKVRLNKGAL